MDVIGLKTVGEFTDVDKIVREKGLSEKVVGGV